MSEPVFGIDLGTTNSVIAVVRDGVPTVLDVAGAAIVPSVVGLDPAGTLLVGAAARNQRAAYPERTISSVKRRMGSDDRIRLGNRELTPPEVSALILKELCRGAAVATGQPVRRVVITVPAFFQDAQRAATRLAGEIAGLDVVRLINEPTAAALAFEGAEPGRERTLLVYDLGGGTFDVSIVTTDGELTEVLASHGDVMLGGDDFDRLLAELLLRDVDGADALDAVAKARVLEAAEHAKCRLTEDVAVQVREEFLRGGSSPLHLDVHLERADLEELIDPLIERTLDSVHEALTRAGRTLSQIDDVLLVGGQTRTPRIAQRLRTLTGVPPRRDVHPDLCVALGAAIAGAQAAGQSTGRVLVDVTPYSFGPSALGELDGRPYDECYVPIIERGTPLPVVRSDTLYTTVDDQERIDARIFQGESADARHNLLIGRFWVDDLPPLPAHSPITFRFALGLDGILDIEVAEPSTGQTKRARIDGATARLGPDQLQAARERTLALWAEREGGAEDEPEPAAADLAAELDDAPDWARELRALAMRARELFDRMSGDDREEAEALVEDAFDAIARDDESLAGRLHAELDDLVHYVEEA
ncbi:MAG: Hsp70 family protein [Planctomycetes bacterium]|nr:Hsp70 family protein [Planctomycetota bacterium]